VDVKGVYYESYLAHRDSQSFKILKAWHTGHAPLSCLHLFFYFPCQAIIQINSKPATNTIYTIHTVRKDKNGKKRERKEGLTYP
jgi:hypothetical protein